MDSYGEQLALTYDLPCRYLDLFKKNGVFFQRIFINDLLDDYDLVGLEITQVLFPRLKWSDRRMEFYDRNSKVATLKKIVIMGTCIP